MTSLTVTLPRRIGERLLRFCAAEGEQPGDVVADAVALHLDATEEEEDGGALMAFAAALPGASA